MTCFLAKDEAEGPIVDKAEDLVSPCLCKFAVLEAWIALVDDLRVLHGVENGEFGSGDRWYRFMV